MTNNINKQIYVQSYYYVKPNKNNTEESNQSTENTNNNNNKQITADDLNSYSQYIGMINAVNIKEYQGDNKDTFFVSDVLMDYAENDVQYDLTHITQVFSYMINTLKTGTIKDTYKFLNNFQKETGIKLGQDERDKIGTLLENIATSYGNTELSASDIAANIIAHTIISQCGDKSDNKEALTAIVSALSDSVINRKGGNIIDTIYSIIEKNDLTDYWTKEGIETFINKVAEENEDGAKNVISKRDMYEIGNKFLNQYVFDNTDEKTGLIKGEVEIPVYAKNWAAKELYIDKVKSNEDGKFVFKLVNGTTINVYKKTEEDNNSIEQPSLLQSYIVNSDGTIKQHNEYDENSNVVKTEYYKNNEI